MTTLGATKTRAFTMIELLIAITVFSIVILIVLQSFVKVIDYNRKAIQNQGIQDHAEFIFQLMTREIRTAKINYSDNCHSFYNNFDLTSTDYVKTNQIYSIATVSSAPAIFFENANSECVAFYIQSDAAANNIKRLRVARCAHQNNPNRCAGPTNLSQAYVTPQDIEVLKFTARASDFSNLAASEGDRHRPASVSYYIKLRSFIWQPPEIEFTNFITARNGAQF
mgnify:FL=1